MQEISTLLSVLRGHKLNPSGKNLSPKHLRSKTHLRLLVKIISTGITLTLANRDINLNKMGRKIELNQELEKVLGIDFEGTNTQG